MEATSNVQHDRKVDIIAAATFTAGAPAAANLISTWKVGGEIVRSMLLELWGSDGSVDLAGPLEVAGYDANLGRWFWIAMLDAGAAVNIGDGTTAPGRAWILDEVPAWATAIQLKTGTISGGSISGACVKPIAARGGR